MMKVIKRDGTKVPFDKEKIIAYGDVTKKDNERQDFSQKAM